MYKLYSQTQHRKPELTPWYWKLKTNFGEARLQRYDVTRDMKVKMQHLIDGTCNQSALGRGVDQVQAGSYSSLAVVKVERIEDPELWMKYKMATIKLIKNVERAQPTKCELDRQRVDSWDPTWMPKSGLHPEVNEQFLFHGTKPDLVDKLIASGFEERLAALSGLYGAGVYFAEKSHKSDQYTQRNAGGVHFMFVARVALGAHVYDARQHENNRRILDEVPGGSGVRHSALLGLAGGHREFVIFDGAQAYPEFLLHYKRR